MRVNIDSNGNKQYYNDKNQLYKEEFPDGSIIWSINGKLHREDGPAIECPNGYKVWYLDGINYSEQEFDKIILKYKWNKFVKDYVK